MYFGCNRLLPDVVDVAEGAAEHGEELEVGRALRPRVARPVLQPERLSAVDERAELLKKGEERLGESNTSAPRIWDSHNLLIDIKEGK